MSISINRNSTVKEPGIKGFLYWWIESDHNPGILIFDSILGIAIIASTYCTYLELMVDDVHPMVESINLIFLIFFITEYCLRFYVCSDFLHDWRELGPGKAFLKKIDWMLRFYSIIDLIALLPAIRYFRLFRAIRILRFLKFIRVIKIASIFTDFKQNTLVFRKLSSDWRFYGVIFLVSVLLIFFLSFGVFIIEENIGSQKYTNFSESLWHSLKLIKLGDTRPSSNLSRILLSIIMISNVMLVSVIISFMSNKVRHIMEKISEGSIIDDSGLDGHIVLCGFTHTTKIVIDELLNEPDFKQNIVLITEKDVQVDGVVTLKGDFTDKDILQNVHLGSARTCIVFAEQRGSDDDKTIDMRSIMTAFLIEYDYPSLHTIVELNDKENATTVNDKVKVNEFINKEEIDGKLIAASIKTPNLSKHFKQLYFNKGLGDVKISKVSELLTKSNDINYRQLKEESIEKDFTIIGIISKDDNKVISIKNDDMISINDSVIYT